MHHNALCLLWNVSIVINRREKKEYVFGSSWWMCKPDHMFTVSSHIDFFRHFDRGINDWLCKWANNQFHLCIITCIIFIYIAIIIIHRKKIFNFTCFSCSLIKICLWLYRRKAWCHLQGASCNHLHLCCHNSVARTLWAGLHLVFL